MRNIFLLVIVSIFFTGTVFSQHALQSSLGPQNVSGDAQVNGLMRIVEAFILAFGKRENRIPDKNECKVADALRIHDELVVRERNADNRVSELTQEYSSKAQLYKKTTNDSLLARFKIIKGESEFTKTPESNVQTYLPDTEKSITSFSEFEKSIVKEAMKWESGRQSLQQAAVRALADLPRKNNFFMKGKDGLDIAATQLDIVALKYAHSIYERDRWKEYREMVLKACVNGVSKKKVVSGSAAEDTATKAE